jgi:Uri superfamily endonuclease
VRTNAPDSPSARANEPGPEPGTYALVLRATRRARVVAGRLGPLELRPGWYVYVGSALGPGGLGARLAHHRRRARAPHWHVDALRRVTRLDQVWYVREPRQLECVWARLLSSLRGASLPLARFGASDCRCASHLYRFERAPSLAAFRRRVRAEGATNGRVERAGA